MIVCFFLPTSVRPSHSPLLSGSRHNVRIFFKSCPGEGLAVQKELVAEVAAAGEASQAHVTAVGAQNLVGLPPGAVPAPPPPALVSSAPCRAHLPPPNGVSKGGSPQGGRGSPCGLFFPEMQTSLICEYPTDLSAFSCMSSDSSNTNSLGGCLRRSPPNAQTPIKVLQIHSQGLAAACRQLMQRNFLAEIQALENSSRAVLQSSQPGTDLWTEFFFYLGWGKGWSWRRLSVAPPPPPPVGCNCLRRGAGAKRSPFSGVVLSFSHPASSFQCRITGSHRIPRIGGVRVMFGSSCSCIPVPVLWQHQLVPSILFLLQKGTSDQRQSSTNVWVLADQQAQQVGKGVTRS